MKVTISKCLVRGRMSKKTKRIQHLKCRDTFPSNATI